MSTEEIRSETHRVPRLAEQSLTYMKELGDMWCASPLKLLGQLCMAQGDLMVARTLLEESLAITKATGLKGGEAVEPRISLAYLSALQGNLAAARRLYQESLALLSSAFSKEFIAASLEGLGAVEVGQGEPLKAARLWGTAEALRESIGAPLYPVYRADYNKAVATARAELSDEAFAMAWSEGRTTPLEQVIDDVLRTVD